MSFRRMPFQFTTTDPIERQRELERRFGLPTSRNMFVDVPNPLLTGAVPRELNKSSSSPRLQHRVPIFVDGHDQPIHSSVDSTGSYPENKKANVRVIPIEIEGAESRPARQRTFSGPVQRADDTCERNFIDRIDASPLKRSMEDLSRPSKVKNNAGPRVHNIPIQFEGSNNIVKNTKLENAKKSVKDCTVTKSFKSPGKENKTKEEINNVKPEDQHKIGIENSLKKIENVLEELKTYEGQIEEFGGTMKDKKYKYLDEMLTRCMIKLDDVDTMGNENVRSTRKNAVKKIQAQIDLLENKANAVNKSETTLFDKNQAQVSKINDTTSGEISDHKSDEQNKVEITECVESKLLEKENTVVNITEARGKLEGQLDTEMTEIDVDVKQSNEGMESQQDAEMVGKIEDQGGVKQTKEMIVSQLEAEMVEKPDYEDESERHINSKYLTTSEQSGNVHEVEMIEIGEPSIAQDKSENCEIEEVEMTEKCTSQVNSDRSNVDNPDEAGNEQIINPQDVEMGEVQNILDNAKKQVVEKIALNQTKENNAGDVAEATPCSTNEVSQDKQYKIDIKSVNGPHISETSNVED